MRGTAIRFFLIAASLASSAIAKEPDDVLHLKSNDASSTHSSAAWTASGVPLDRKKPKMRAYRFSDGEYRTLSSEQLAKERAPSKERFPQLDEFYGAWWQDELNGYPVTQMKCGEGYDLISHDQAIGSCWGTDQSDYECAYKKSEAKIPAAREAVRLEIEKKAKTISCQTGCMWRLKNTFEVFDGGYVQDQRGIVWFST